MLLPYMDPEQAFKTLAFEWQRAKIGSPRDANGKPIEADPPFAPLLVARGSALDSGQQVPMGALRSVNAFLEWSKENGFEQGISLRVEGLVKAPGRIAKTRGAWSPSPLGEQGPGYPDTKSPNKDGKS